MTFAEKLKKYMDENNISQYKLKKLTGVGQSTISQILSGIQSPTDDTIRKILSGLNISYAEFYSDADLVSATIAKADSMPKSEDEKAALERLKAMPVDEQQRRVLAEYNRLTPEQRIAIDVILRSLASSR
jgi:transcriptional regulator with XRE-family HTH domain